MDWYFTYSLRLRLLDMSRLPDLRSRQTLESIASTENMPANHEVEEDRSSNTNPDEHIVSVDANVFPVPVNPAPDLSMNQPT
jgi:hypothetical protein